MGIAIKILLAALLLGCLFKVPYGYFQFIRIAGCIGFCYLAYEEYKSRKIITEVLCIACAILLNPVIKIHFSRPLWNTIDLIIAILLAVWIIFDFEYLHHRKNRKKTTEKS